MKRIIILGSTGSIGKSLLNIIYKDKKSFQIELLTANKNYKLLLDQAILFDVKNVILTDKKNFNLSKKIFEKKKIKLFNNFSELNKFLNKKVDYVMSSIVGLEGLEPTLNIIQYTKKIAIANKETIICAWDLIKKKLNKHKTEFVPVDSEHFSLWFGLKGNNKNIKEIYLTASGGPFLNLPIKNFKNINVKKALKHPNWKMGKKISIDSATMMNKVFEVIEAKKIFDIDYNNIKILTHPSSYIHSIIKYKNGFIKLIAHNTDMKIPISSTLNIEENSFSNIKLDIKKLNQLNLNIVNKQQFPITNILKFLPKNNSLFETVVVSANDELVRQFLKQKIRFSEISLKLLKILKKKEFSKYKKIYPNNVNDILYLSNYVRSKISTKGI